MKRQSTPLPLRLQGALRTIKEAEKNTWGTENFSPASLREKLWLESQWAKRTKP
jgi:hypothetical protein